MRLRAGFVCLSLVVAGLLAGNVLADLEVAPGWDLLQTPPAGATFMGVPFNGVPLGTYNFGGGIGVQNTGMADTIVQRLSTASVGSAPNTAAPINIELVALQLMSAVAFDPGPGLDFYYITLQSNRGGTASTGTMTINFLDAIPDAFDGTFSSGIDVAFDFRKGALNGPIVFSDNLSLSNAAADWGRVPPPGAVTITGVNTNLNGTNNTSDFWPGPISESHPSGAMHNVVTAVTAVPEANGFVAVGTVVIGIGIAHGVRRLRHQKSQRVKLAQS